MGDCFIYNNSAWRLNYCVGTEVTTMYHLDRPMYLLGYLIKEARIYLIDKVCRLLQGGAGLVDWGTVADALAHAGVRGCEL